MSLAPFEIVLPRRVVPNPQPELHKGGDCGACALGGVIGWTPARVYEELVEKVESISWWEMQRLLRVARFRGLVDRIQEDPPAWQVRDALATWGSPAWHQQVPWFRHVLMAIDAGYYALAMVNHGKAGPVCHGADHWVLLCGARESDNTNRRELLVSCSSRTTPDEEWVEVDSFLRERGGFNVLLARPAP